MWCVGRHWSFSVPVGNLLHYIIGEGHGKELRLFVDNALEYYQETGQLDKSSIPITPPSISHPSSDDNMKAHVLSYPGKVYCGDEKLYVSDTSHHRIVAVDKKSGVVTDVYGNGSVGLRDGAASEAQFHSPQGLVVNGDILYVADTENHVIRQVCITCDYHVIIT